MNRQQPLICSKFYRLFEKKPNMKVDSKSLVVLGDKEYVKFPFEAIYVNEEVVLYFMIEAKEEENKPTPEFQYVRVEISIIHNIKKQVIHNIKETTRTLKKDSPHMMPFFFKVSEEGEYMIRTTTSYREKQFITSQHSSGVQEKEETAVMRLQINKIFGVKEKVIYLEKEKLIVFVRVMQTYPLLVQYTVENLTNKPRAFKADFVSDKFSVQNLDPRPSYQMNGLQSESIIIKLQPKDIQSLFQTTKLGHFRIFWEKDGKEEKPLVIKFDQIVKIKCTSLTKSISKKDIHSIRIRIQKKLHFEYPSIELSIRDGKDQVSPSIRVLNMSKNKITLVDRSFDEVELSVVGLAAGSHLLKGLRLRTMDGEEIPYQNQILIMITNEAEEKQEKKLFEVTDVFDVFDQHDILE